MNTTHLILAYYFLSPIEDPQAEVTLHKNFLQNLDAACRIYISEEGLNGQASFKADDAHRYMNWMRNRPEFSGIKFKLHEYHEHVFPRLSIKYRKQLVAFDSDVDLGKRGEHVSPSQWKQMLENEKDRVLLDVRNDYETKVGSFAGADLPPCETFREFNEYAEQLKDKVDPEKTPVMMYCTGGIRCEYFSSLLKQKGFEKVYQLDGGIINYGIEEGSDHWLGKLFVFDDRLVMPIGKDETPVVGKCHHCGTESEAYYNCANMDCNYLFLCCPSCLQQFAGCCCQECQTGDRVRPYHHQNPHKPFRRWYNYFPGQGKGKS